MVSGSDPAGRKYSLRMFCSLSESERGRAAKPSTANEVPIIGQGRVDVLACQSRYMPSQLYSISLLVVTVENIDTAQITCTVSLHRIEHCARDAKISTLRQSIYCRLQMQDKVCRDGHNHISFIMIQ